MRGPGPGPKGAGDGELCILTRGGSRGAGPAPGRDADVARCRRCNGNDRSALAGPCVRRRASRRGRRDLPVDRRIVHRGWPDRVAATAGEPGRCADGRDRIPILPRAARSTGRLVPRSDVRRTRDGLLDDHVRDPAPRLSGESGAARPAGAPAARRVRDPARRRAAALDALRGGAGICQRPRLLAERACRGLDRQGPARASSHHDNHALRRAGAAVVASEPAAPSRAAAGAGRWRDDAFVRRAARRRPDQRHEVANAVDGHAHRAGDRSSCVPRRASALAPRPPGDRRPCRRVARRPRRRSAPVCDRAGSPRSVRLACVLATRVRNLRRSGRAGGHAAGGRRRASDHADRP